MIIDFPTRFVREAKTQKMPEAQGLIALIAFLKGFAKSQHEAGVEIVHSKEGGASSWPEAIQYLSRNYAQSSRISSAIANLRTGSQGLMETEREIENKLNKSICRCGNVYPREEVLALYINAEHPTINSVVSWYRESYRRATCLNFVGFAQNEGNAMRALPTTPQPRGKGKPLTKVHPTALRQTLADMETSSA